MIKEFTKEDLESARQDGKNYTLKWMLVLIKSKRIWATKELVTKIEKVMET